MILDILKLANKIAYPKKQGREAIELDEIDDELLTRIWLEVANKRNRQAKEEKLWTKKEWEAYSKAHPATEIRPKFRKKDDSKKDDSSPIDSFGFGGKSSIQHDPRDIEFHSAGRVWEEYEYSDWYKGLGNTDQQRKMAIAHLAGLGGLPKGTIDEVKINFSPREISVTIYGKHISEFDRVILPTENTIKNNYFELEKDAPRGIGLRVFASQVANARKFGFDRISTYAAGVGDGTMDDKEDEYNGYYTWARFGYKGKVGSDVLEKKIFQDEVLEKAEQAGKREEIQAKIDNGDLTTHDIMLIGAQDAWKKYGTDFEGNFGLSETSTSSEILGKYIKEKKDKSSQPQYRTNSDGYLHGGEKTPAVETPNGVKAYFDNGLLSRHSGPAITTEGSYEEYWLDGEKLSKSDWESQKTEVDSEGTLFWRNDAGQLHRDGDKPAIIEPDGHKEYWLNGKRHRDGDKPALISENGSQLFFKNGKQHRDGDKPARIYPNGTKEYYKNDKMHRLSGPSVIKADGTKEWYLDNKRMEESQYSNHPDVISWGNNKEWTKEEWAEYKKLHPNTKIKPNFKSDSSKPKPSQPSSLGGISYDFFGGQPIVKQPVHDFFN